MVPMDVCHITTSTSNRASMRPANGMTTIDGSLRQPDLSTATPEDIVTVGDEEKPRKPRM